MQKMHYKLMTGIKVPEANKHDSAMGDLIAKIFELINQ